MALSKMIEPTVFGPFTATVVGVAGVVPNVATAPTLFGVPPVQFPAVVQSPSAAPPFHSDAVAVPMVSVIVPPASATE